MLTTARRIAPHDEASMNETHHMFLIVCGLLFVGITIMHIVRGRRSAYWGGIAERKSSPRKFWFTIALDAAIAVGVLVYGIFGWARS